MRYSNIDDDIDVSLLNEEDTLINQSSADVIALKKMF